MPPFQKFCNLRVLPADRRGAVTLDYAVLGSGVIVAALVAITSLGGTLDRRFTEIGERIAAPASGGSASPSAVPAATAPLPGGGPSQGIHSGAAASSGGTGTGTAATGKSETGTTTTGQSATGAGGGSGGTSGSAHAAQTGTGTGTSGGGASSGGGATGTKSGGTTGGNASGSGTTAGTTPKNCRTVGNGRNVRVVCEDDEDDD